MILDNLHFFDRAFFKKYWRRVKQIFLGNFLFGFRGPHESLHRGPPSGESGADRNYVSTQICGRQRHKEQEKIRRRRDRRRAPSPHVFPKRALVVTREKTQVAKTS